MWFIGGGGASMGGDIYALNNGIGTARTEIKKTEIDFKTRLDFFVTDQEMKELELVSK